jgi:hypothetical protein
MSGWKKIDREGPRVSFEAWGRELLRISFESGASFGFKVGAFTLVQLINQKKILLRYNLTKTLILSGSASNLRREILMEPFMRL